MQTESPCTEGILLLTEHLPGWCVPAEKEAQAAGGELRHVLCLKGQSNVAFLNES
jgi:hypothetical protein